MHLQLAADILQVALYPSHMHWYVCPLVQFSLESKAVAPFVYLYTQVDGYFRCVQQQLSYTNRCIHTLHCLHVYIISM